MLPYFRNIMQALTATPLRIEIAASTINTELGELTKDIIRQPTKDEKVLLLEKALQEFADTYNHVYNIYAPIWAKLAELDREHNGDFVINGSLHPEYIDAHNAATFITCDFTLHLSHYINDLIKDLQIYPRPEFVEQCKHNKSFIALCVALEEMAEEDTPDPQAWLKALTPEPSTPMESTTRPLPPPTDDSPILSKYPARVTAEIHERLERTNILTIEKGKYKWTGKNKNKLAYILLCLYYGESNPKEWEEGDAPAKYIASFCPDTNGLARTISKTKTTIKENFPKTLIDAKHIFDFSVQAEEERIKEEAKEERKEADKSKRLALDLLRTENALLGKQDAKQ